MSIPDRIKELIETFDNNLESYKKSNYNETQVRREFIDPFFEELGWDVSNRQGHAEAYKDVIHEDAIKVGGVTKAPDYCFRIGGTRKFFLEAKKPSINIQEDIKPAYQLRRYGWSAKLPLSILTDFEELAVYDCRVKPSKNDKASHSRILYLTYTDYENRWEELADIFSKDAVLKGSFDKYAESNKKKKGTTEVDTAFLHEIENWRELLARNIALRNPNISQRELNFAVQQIIDRIVFLRICEDRGMETYGALMELREGENVYTRLFQLFKKADEKYNSGLFHFKQEKGRENYDNLTPALQIDDKPLKEIFKNLYYPESPYEFSVLSADILGQVYERFLGKVIRLTVGHQAKIEEKPEVRKAGGVYYTPSYIVDYIVKNTVGKLVQGKSPGPKGGVRNLKILDPACGSGSFLIGAYQFLLDWHRDEYINDGVEKWSKGKIPRIYQSQKGEWRLTTDERKRILLNNIYGVDIDHQAVEVTKLSLLLKVLEGEDEQSIGKQKQMRLFQERVLPDLSNNIKCGNSLIGPDFYNNQQMSVFEEEVIYRVNTFDWQNEFSDIMKDGGFDTVIGNPPYGALFSKQEADYLAKKYFSCEYQINSFVLFIEKGGSFLRENGNISFITPAVFLTQHYFSRIRKIILENYTINNILVLNYKVFKQANIGDTCVFVLSNFTQKKDTVKYAILKNESISMDNMEIDSINQQCFLSNPRHEFFLSDNSDLFSKFRSIAVPLGELSNCVMGIKPYQKGKGKPKQTADDVKSRLYDADFKKNESYKQYLIGKDIDRYCIKPKEERYICYGEWLAEPRYSSPFEDDKIILRQTSDKIRAVFDKEKYYNLNNIYNIYLRNKSYSYCYILGIINSSLMVYLYQRIVPEKDKLFAEIKKNNLAKLPIRTINFDDSADMAHHDRMVAIVEQMMDLKKQLALSKISQEIDILKRLIESTDKQIDDLVYKLYDLTDKEIKMVESKC